MRDLNLPSNRKQKLREDKLSEEGWFRITSDLWTEFGEIKPKLRLVADENFPLPLVKLLRGRKIDIKTAQSLKLHTLADENLLPKVAELGYVLITLDRDFWSDEKFPLHQCGGVIFVVGEDERIGNTLGFELLIAFLKSMGGGMSHGKIRASSDSVYWKGTSSWTKKFVYEIKAIRPWIYAREVEGFGG